MYWLHFIANVINRTHKRGKFHPKRKSATDSQHNNPVAEDLSVVLDLYDYKVVGYSLSDNMLDDNKMIPSNSRKGNCFVYRFPRLLSADLMCIEVFEYIDRVLTLFSEFVR